MKHFLLLFACLTAPAFAAPKPLPPEVGAMMPQNIVSLGTYELSPARNAPKYLVHMWTAPRRNPAGGEWYGIPKNPYTGAISEKEVRSNTVLLFPSPFVLDVFSNPSKPKYETSIILTAQRAPHEIALHYFNVKTKQGFVLETKNGTSMQTKRTFFVFENELAGNYVEDSVESNASSGGYRRFRTSRDANGQFQLVEESGSAQGNSSSMLRWNGREFAWRK